ncbi:MAG: RNA methyltransferase [Rhodocyclales bacterium]|nr:RNA methyltransferase [Rhodocyclales bacterium]
MKKITSRDNPTFKLLHALAESSRERRKRQKTLLDGMHLVAAYSERFGLPELIAVSEHGLQQAEIAAFLRANPQADPVLFGDGVFNEISPVATPTGIVAVVAQPESAGQGRPGKSWVLLDAVQDAGNLGSILRSAAAAGISDIFLGPGCAQAWSPRVLRAGMGAHFSVGIHEHAVLDEVLRGFAGTTVSASLQGGKAIYELDLRGPVAWLFGSEGSGLSPALAGLAKRAAHIPMPGAAESLNVAAAAAVCLFEEVRQKAGARG